MGRTCSRHGKKKKKNAYRILVVNSEGKRPLGSHRCKREDAIKIDIREIGWGGMDWINLV
jgi:hypothetical protein